MNYIIKLISYIRINLNKNALFDTKVKRDLDFIYKIITNTYLIYFLDIL